MFYGTTQYDPIYIIAQIASIQAIFYVTLGALLWVLVGKESSLRIMSRASATGSLWQALQDHMPAT